MSQQETVITTFIHSNFFKIALNIQKLQKQIDIAYAYLPLKRDVRWLVDWLLIVFSVWVAFILWV